MYRLQCACFDSWHDWTTGDSIGIDVLPMDPMDHFPTLVEVFLHFRFHLMTRTSGDLSGPDSSSGFGLQVLSIGIESIEHD